MRLTKPTVAITVAALVLMASRDIHAQAERVWYKAWFCSCESGWGCGLPHVKISDSGSVYLTYADEDDIVVAKHDQMGNDFWHRQYGFGATTAILPQAITADQYDNVYVAGRYDPDWTQMGSNPREMEIVILKYTSEGILAWETHYPIPNLILMPSVSDMEATPDGFLYIYGSTGNIYEVWPPDNRNPQYEAHAILVKCETTNGNIEWQDESDYGYHAAFVPSQWPCLDIQNDGSVLIMSRVEADRLWCLNESQTDSAILIVNGLFLVRYSTDGDILTTAEYTREVVPESCYNAGIAGMQPNNMAFDNLGNIYIAGSFRDISNNTNNSLILKFSAGLSLEWEKDLAIEDMVWDRSDMIIDLDGNVVYSDNETTIKLNSAGEIVWTGQPGGHVEIDKDNNLYVGGRGLSNLVEFYDHEEIDAYPEWGINTEGSKIWNMIVDSLGDIFVASQGWSWCDQVRVGRFSQNHFLHFCDPRGDTLKNIELELSRIHNDAPLFTEEKLGNFKVDSLGLFKFPLIPDGKMVFPISPGNPEPDTLSRGDTLKMSRLINDSSAVKHPPLINTMYSIHQDNLEFDSLGEPSYDTIMVGAQNIVIDHAEVRYNLVVSVEWDASKVYLQSLESCFRSMSNYLYDVTDGQVRLDTVAIYDDGEHWLEADAWIFADNQQWPLAWADSMNSPGQFTIMLPRKWNGNATDTRNHTYHNHPLNLDDPMDYRTKTHEFGHYALGFYDEYIFWNAATGKYEADPALKCGVLGGVRYGFMEYQYPSPDPHSTEMSSGFSYQDPDCRNTEQFGYSGTSCWDFFQSRFEGLYCHDTFFVEIYKPDDTIHLQPDGVDYFEGPNNDMTSPMSLDYDVGSKIVFINSPADPAPPVKEVDVDVRVGGTSMPGAEVFLLKPSAGLTWRTIKQGKTADVGHIMVLGAEPGDRVQSTGFTVGVTSAAAWRQGAEIWHSGEITIDADSMPLDLAPVDGHFPMICEAVLGGSAVEVKLAAENLFATLPSLYFRPSGGGEYAYGFSAILDGYSTTLAEPAGISGVLTITAENNSASPFFFVNSYTRAAFAPKSSGIEFYGSGGESQVLFDSDNGDLEQAMLLSSPYVIIRTALTDANIQASKTHSLSVYPGDAMTGSGLMRILYSEADIVMRGGAAEDEATLKIFRWIDAVTGWQEVGGSVDTVLNQVVETISEPGVYAAFTTDGSVDVEDNEYGDLLPYRFELQQNYPNPFNPVTTIEYSLPRRSCVTVEVFNVLGQKVRTLVDREESAGSYTITWDGTTANGQSAATGIYLYRFEAGDHTETKKMLLLK